MGSPFRPLIFENSQIQLQVDFVFGRPSLKQVGIASRTWYPRDLTDLSSVAALKGILTFLAEAMHLYLDPNSM